MTLEDKKFLSFLVCQTINLQWLKANRWLSEVDVQSLSCWETFKLSQTYKATYMQMALNATTLKRLCNMQTASVLSLNPNEDIGALCQGFALGCYETGRRKNTFSFVFLHGLQINAHRSPFRVPSSKVFKTDKAKNELSYECLSTSDGKLGQTISRPPLGPSFMEAPNTVRASNKMHLFMH